MLSHLHWFLLPKVELNNNGHKLRFKAAILQNFESEKVAHNKT